MDPTPAHAALNLNTTLSVVGLLVGVIGGALGAFSILVTWKLYQASNALNVKMIDKVSKIETSSHSVEVTTNSVTKMMLQLLVDIVGQNFQGTVTGGAEKLRKELEQHIERRLRTIDGEAAQTAINELVSDLKASIRSFRYQATAEVEREEMKLARAASSQPQRAANITVPALPRVLQWLIDHEHKYDFYSVKFLRTKVFKDDPAAQEALQFAIDQGLLSLGKTENPQHPVHPVTTCAIDKEDERIQDILRWDPPTLDL